MTTRNKIEEKVFDLLRKHDVHNAPVKVDALARSEGLQIVESAFDGDVSGALLRSNGIRGIAINAKQHPNRSALQLPTS